MNEETKVPEKIAVIIDAEVDRVEAKKKAVANEEERQRKERTVLGYARMKAYITARLLFVPEMLQPYCVGINRDDNDDDDDDEYASRRGGESDRFGDESLRFEVPGLSPLIFSKKSDTEDQWACLAVETHDYTNQPRWKNWQNAYRRYARLETVLAAACFEWDKYQQLGKKYVEQQERGAREAEAEERREAASWERSEAKREEEKAEEQALFDALKNDPAAVALMKAFLFIQQERSGFEAQINDANDSIVSMEGFWSRQAEDADRRARDKDSRISDLQNDLDDAQSEIKTMKRSW